MAEDLLIRISADTKRFTDELKKVSQQTEDLEGALTKMAKVSGLAFAAFTGTIGLTIAAYRDQELAVNQLNAALRNQGLNVKDLSKEYQDMATELSRLTTFGDEEIISAQARLQSYLGEQEVTKELTKAVLDLASAKGMDLASAADMVGKTIGTSTNALARQGIEVDDNADKHTRLTQVLEGINGKWRDQSIAAAQGSGVFIQLKNAIGEIAEEIGKNLVPMLTPVVKGLQGMVIWAQEHPELAKFAAQALIIGAAVTAVATGLSLAVVGFIKLKAVMTAAALATSTMSLSIKGLLGATGIGVLLILVGDLALNWKTRFAQMQAIFGAFTENISELGEGLGTVLKGVFTFNIDEIKEGLAQIKEAFADGYESYRETRKEQKELEAAEEREQDALNFEAKMVQKAEQSEIEKEVDRQIAEEKKKREVDERKRFLQDQKKFGTEYAMINKVMNSEIYQGQKQAFGELAQLQTSSNATLKSIGKTAAIANIIIKTAESAMAIYAGFSTIPIIGPALGIAGAAAAVAFGAEQVGRVNAAADGGLITGGRAGRDSVPALLTPGELVVPTRNFSDVVNAVANQKMQETRGETGVGIAGVEGAVSVAIAFDGEEAERVITARQVEARALGTVRE